MQELDDQLAGTGSPGLEPERRRSALRRTLWALAVMAILIALAVLPPLVNVSRYQHRIATSIGESLGRPVRLDSITLTMLPWPGFEIANLVVGEDPDFGSEPIIRANVVRATLRVGSLWRRRIEVSKISFDSPSVNLVHLPDGRWNLESILLQAARIQAAPTAQKTAGEAPRFPYIEATDARLNLKQGSEKLPISLTDAEFALWLARPEQWQLRLEAHPARTDTGVSDTGTLRVEGTLGRAASLGRVPIDLKADWSAAPLGAVSWIVASRDAGVRGEMHLTASARGTAGDNQFTAHLQLKNARGADFVPAAPLSVEIECTARATNLFHTLEDARCTWPAGSGQPGLTVTGSMTEIQRPMTAEGIALITGVPASALLSGLRVASGRFSPDLLLTGTVQGNVRYPLASTPKTPDPDHPANQIEITDAQLRQGDQPPFLKGPVTLAIRADGLDLLPVSLDLGGKEPATLEGRIQARGYSLHLSGAVLRSRLTAFGTAVPQIGDGLAQALPAAAPAPPATETPLHLDLLSQRQWTGPRVWTEAATPHPPAPRRAPRRR